MTKEFFKENKFEDFSQFEEKVKSLESTTEKGNVFEIFGKYFFEYYKERYRIKNIWIPDTKIPNSIKERLNISERDKGADGLLENIDGEFYVFQAKFRSDRTSATYDELTNAFFNLRIALACMFFQIQLMFQMNLEKMKLCSQY